MFRSFVRSWKGTLDVERWHPRNPVRHDEISVRPARDILGGLGGETFTCFPSSHGPPKAAATVSWPAKPRIQSGEEVRPLPFFSSREDRVPFASTSCPSDFSGGESKRRGMGCGGGGSPDERAKLGYFHPTSLFRSGSFPPPAGHDHCMGVAKTSRPGTGWPLLQQCLFESVGEAWRRVPNALGSATPPGPAAPGLHCSGLRWRRHACFSTAVPDSLSLEVGGRSRSSSNPASNHRLRSNILLPEDNRSLDSRTSPKERTRTPQHFLLGSHGGPEGRITADCHPPTNIAAASTTPTKYRRGAEAKAGGERATSFLGSLQLPRSPAPPRPVVGETTPSRLDSKSFPSVPLSIEFPPSLRPSRPRPTRISRLVAKIPGWSPQVHHHPTASGSSHLVVVWCLARWDGGWRWSCAPETVGLPGGMWQMTFMLGTGLTDRTGSQSSAEISPIRTNWCLSQLSSHRRNLDKEYLRLPPSRPIFPRFPRLRP